jgi:RNase P subunit RPR2
MVSRDESLAASIASRNLTYLNDAAHLLRASAPQTSAYLMHRCSELVGQQEVAQPENIRKQHVCGSCGLILVPGNGCTLRFSRPRLARKKRNQTGRPRQSDKISAGVRIEPSVKPSAPLPLSKLYTCGLCHQTTKISLPPAPRVIRKQSKPDRPLSVLKTELATPKLSSNASSKKRAKNRKAGLQALLSQNQAAKGQPGRGLSLTDFMKR